MKLPYPDFMNTVQDGGKVVSLTHRPPLPTRNTPGTLFCYKLNRPHSHRAIGRILCQLKFPMTTFGIEPATSRFIRQHLNHSATAVPTKHNYNSAGLNISGTQTQHQFLPEYPVQISNINLLPATSIRQQQ